MLNYIRAELYKLMCRKYTYIALSVLLALEGLLVAGNVFHNAHGGATYFGEAITMIPGFGAIGFCVCLLTGDIVFAGQYKNSTLKNEVSFGLGRARIYLGKLMAQTLLSLLYLAVMMGFFIGLSAIFLPHSMSIHYNDLYSLIIVGYYLAFGLPLWIGAQAAACMCLFLISSEAAASTAYLSILFLLEPFLEVAGYLIRGKTGEWLIKACGYLPRPMLDVAKTVVGDWAFLGLAWLVGAFWLAVTTAAGLYGFSRKEIK